MVRIKWNAIYRTDLTTLGRIIVPHAFGALIWIDFINLKPHVNSIIGALWLTYVTVDAFVCNH